jgi:hypothetical protein
MWLIFEKSPIVIIIHYYKLFGMLLFVNIFSDGSRVGTGASSPLAKWDLKKITGKIFIFL